MLCQQLPTMIEKVFRRHLHQVFVIVPNYTSCNIFVKIWYFFSVTTTLLATNLYQGLIFVGIWHTKLKFIFNKVVTQYPNKGAAAKMVRYYNQNDSINNIISKIFPKWFLAVMTPWYIAFILTENWFGQTCFENDLSVIFGFLTQKWIKALIFMKIQWTKLKIWIKMHYHKFSRWSPRRWKRGIVVPTFDLNVSETVWDRSLKFSTFTYPHSMHMFHFHWNLERWVSGMSHFDVEFPFHQIIFRKYHVVWWWY